MSNTALLQSGGLDVEGIDAAWSGSAYIGLHWTKDGATYLDADETATVVHTLLPEDCAVVRKRDGTWQRMVSAFEWVPLEN